MWRKDPEWLERAGLGPRYIHISLAVPGWALFLLPGFTKVVLSETPPPQGRRAPAFVLSEASGSWVIFGFCWILLVFSQHLPAWGRRGCEQDLPESCLKVPNLRGEAAVARPVWVVACVLGLCWLLRLVALCRASSLLRCHWHLKITHSLKVNWGGKSRQARAAEILLSACIACYWICLLYNHVLGMAVLKNCQELSTGEVKANLFTFQ